MLRFWTAVVLDYWKQEMAVTGDETESGRVSLTLVFLFIICVTCKSLCLLVRYACTACVVSYLSLSSECFHSLRCFVFYYKRKYFIHPTGRRGVSLTAKHLHLNHFLNDLKPNACK